MKSSKFNWVKLLAVWGTFLLLHFSYETFPNILFQIIGEVGETNYFHMKMLFFAYVLVTLVEFILQRNKISNPAAFLNKRALIATSYPWLTLTIFFTTQALTGGMLEMPWEIIWANLATGLGIYLALRLEEALDEVEFRPSLLWMVWVVFALALMTYIVFSFNTPEHFFETPEGFGHGH